MFLSFRIMKKMADINMLRRPPKHTVNETSFLKYKIVMAKRHNTEYLYVFSEKRFYTFNAVSKKGKTYRCHNRSCKSRVILQPDNLCVKSSTAHNHSCQKDCEEEFKKLSTIQAIKLKCIDISSVASGKRMTAARSIYKEVIAQPEHNGVDVDFHSIERTMQRMKRGILPRVDGKMCPNIYGKCLLCLKRGADGINLMSEFSASQNVAEIMEKYFGHLITMPADNEIPFLCNGCWTKIKSFHKFYSMIENIHKTQFNGLNENTFTICGDTLNLKTDPDENDAVANQENTNILTDTSETDNDGSNHSDENIIKEEYTAKYDDIFGGRNNAITIGSTGDDNESDDDETDNNVSDTSNNDDWNESDDESDSDSFDENADQFESDIDDLDDEPVVPMKKNRTGRRPKGSGSFICDICRKSFKTLKGLKVHISIHRRKIISNLRQKIKLKCKCCPQLLFDSLNQLYGHSHNNKKYQNMNENFPCEICHRPHNTQSALDIHKKIHCMKRKAKEFICDICNDSFDSKKKIKYHLDAHFVKNIQFCDNCDRGERMKALWTKTLRSPMNHIDQETDLILDSDSDISII